MERRLRSLTFDVLAPRWMTNEATATWPAAQPGHRYSTHKAQLVAILRTNDLSQRQPNTMAVPARKKHATYFLNMFEAVCWLDWVPLKNW